MWALWLIPIVVLLGGMFFLLKAFVKMSTAMASVRQELADLGEMGPRLQQLAGELSNLSETVEQRRQQ